MFIRETQTGPLLVTSASDLTAASMCEFAFLRRVDAKLGRAVEVPPDDDVMLARAGALGDEHEERVLSELRATYGPGSAGEPGGVVEIPRPAAMTPEALADVAMETLRALASGAKVVFQATFFDPVQRPAAPEQGEPAIAFLGFADFLELRDDGSYEVQDTKLARRAKVTALMQLAAYAEQLERIGVPVASDATLILGSGERTSHRIVDIAPVFRRRRARLHRILLESFGAVGPDGKRESAPAVAWGAVGVNACGRCEVCEPEIQRTRDPLLIAGLYPRQRDALIAAGLATIDAVAQALPRVEAGSLAVPGLTGAVLERIALQAAVQVETEQTEAEPGVAAPPRVRVVAPAALAALPVPNSGDLFFDFEGDPFYRETRDGTAHWNLDYLFGMVDAREEFTAIWAHSLRDERAALERFIEFVRERREQYPGMRIYHYASYERTHLLSIAARHGVCEAEVDQLLREHVLVDLYPIVRQALRVGSRSYSIKKLEPLYMGAEVRAEDGVVNGAQSVVEYAEAAAQLASGDAAERAAGQRRLDDIADYNRYDCVSTLRLRDWLLGIAHDHGISQASPDLLEGNGEPPVELSRVGAQLLELAEAETDETGRTALKLAASAIDYHQREQKSFWWAHFARLVDPIEDWADTRDVVVANVEASETIEGWHRPPRARIDRRRVRLRGEVAPGSTLKPGAQMFALYEHPAPFPQWGGAPGARAARQVEVVERHEDGVTIEEKLPNDASPFDILPIAVTPGPPPPAGRQKGAIEEWGSSLVTAKQLGDTPRDPVYALLTRARPTLQGGTGLVSPSSDEALAAGGSEDARTIGAVLASLRGLDRAALAVQGPPGTGKTYLAARVIRQLVERDGWRIGVVAQSHKVVENVLEGVVSAGLDARLVAKVPQGGKLAPGAEKPGYTVLGRDGYGSFVDGLAGRGAVIGGTAWDFSNEDRFPRRSLDLLVIDEAGQFSLAPTIAASVAAQRLLLLGDQQQLPQVSQGSHPEPVDQAALSWLLDGGETMPPELGYFLAETRRMHPALTEVVSELSYAGRLHAHPSTLERSVIGADGPGLHWRPVEHRGNSTSSIEEAASVVATVERLLGAGGRPAAKLLDAGGRHAGQRRPLTESDVIVVAAYNAQVECVAEVLAAAGLGHVRVGTVDRFQGQEAAISLVTLAASSPDDVPRGLEFLLMRNRLNVAISRAQWASYLFSAPSLGDGLPTSAEGVAALSGYLRLTERG
ncbi:MAG: TM0106 family RecB-like putative nuclease [Leucobacter sp.]